MKQITINVYSFNELSESAKQNAIDNYRNKCYDNSFFYDEIAASVKAAIDLFGLKTGRTYTDIHYSHIDDNVLQLFGSRLCAYIYNNYGEDLFKPKYLKHGELTDVKKSFHRMRKQREITNNCPNKGKILVSYYSNIQKDNSCTLTGVCYDDDILKPVYDFLSNCPSNVTFEDIIQSIESAINKTYNDCEDWLNSDEFITEELEANNYEFDEDGNRI